MPIEFLPFNAFVPDGGDHGPGLAMAQNALPVHGSWRPLREAATISSQGDGPVTGQFVHVFQQETAVQYMRPDGDVSTTGWEASTGSTFYSLLDETTANDNDFAFAPNAPSAVILIVSLSNPVASSATGHVIRWRYRIPVAPTSTWTVKMELLETTTVRATDTATGTAATAWVQRSYSLSGGEMAAITDRNNLRLRFTATAPGSTQAARPTSDVSLGGWLTDGGSSSSLYATIDETSPSDTDYVESPTLSLGGSSATYVAGLGATITDPLTHAGWQWVYRYAGRNAGVELVVRLKMGSTTIKTVTHSNASTSFTTATQNLSAAEAALITDFSALKMEMQASYPTSTSSTQTQVARPDDDVTNDGAWSPTTGSFLYAMLDEAVTDDGDLIYATTAGTCVVSLDPVVAAGASDSHVWVVRGRKSVATAIVTTKLYCGATLIRTETISFTIAGFADHSYTLTESERTAITDWTDLRVSFFFDKDRSGAGAQAQISQTYVTVPEPRRGAISYAALTTPSASRVEVSWGEMELPDLTSSYKGDVPTVFAGTSDKLFLVEAGGWTDLSKATYATAAAPGGWNFCSIGNHVVATNRVDPVQVRLDNTGAFVDCIASSSPYNPLARYCAPFRQTLLLGDINLSGHAPDEVWWSDINDITNFAPTAPSLAGYIPIRSRPGQITALVGGDFAMVFKRRSIHALDWTGDVLIPVRVRDLSSSVGAPLGRSVVEAEGMVYFWDGLSFRRTDGYSPPERIGSEILSRYLSDASFSDEAFASVDTVSIGEEDSLVSGWYDTALGLIFWTYQAQDDAVVQGGYRKRRIVIYNPFDDRWSTALFPTQTLVSGCANPAVITADPFMSRGSSIFVFDGATTSSWAKFSGGETTEMSFRTRRQAIAVDESDRPMAITITEVLPIFTVKPEGGTIPDVSITVSGAEDVHFQVNVQSETYTRVKARESGWYPHRVTGAWFSIEVTVPATTGTVVAFKGVYVRWEPRGRT